MHGQQNIKQITNQRFKSALLHLKKKETCFWKVVYYILYAVTLEEN